MKALKSSGVVSVTDQLRALLRTWVSYVYWLTLLAKKSTDVQCCTPSGPHVIDVY